MELSGSVSLGLFSKHGSGRIIKLNNLPNSTMLSADKIRRYECSHDKDDNSIQSLIFSNALDYSIISGSPQRKFKEVV